MRKFFDGESAILLTTAIVGLIVSYIFTTELLASQATDAWSKALMAAFAFVLVTGEFMLFSMGISKIRHSDALGWIHLLVGIALIVMSILASTGHLTGRYELSRGDSLLKSDGYQALKKQIDGIDAQLETANQTLANQNEKYAISGPGNRRQIEANQAQTQALISKLNEQRAALASQLANYAGQGQAQSETVAFFESLAKAFGNSDPRMTALFYMIVSAILLELTIALAATELKGRYDACKADSFTANLGGQAVDLRAADSFKLIERDGQRVFVPNFQANTPSPPSPPSTPGAVPQQAAANADFEAEIDETGNVVAVYDRKSGRQMPLKPRPVTDPIQVKGFNNDSQSALSKQASDAGREGLGIPILSPNPKSDTWIDPTPAEFERYIQAMYSDKARLSDGNLKGRDKIARLAGIRAGNTARACFEKAKELQLIDTSGRRSWLTKDQLEGLEIASRWIDQSRGGTRA